MTTSARPRSSPLVLGTLHHPPGSPYPSVVYGAQVAIQAALEGVVRHGTIDRLTAFAAPHRTDALARALRAAARSPGPEIDVQGEQVLMTDGVDRHGVSAWYQTDTSFHAPLHVRTAYAERLYPITFTVHCQSPQSFLHEYYLPMLLGDFQACDSFICTSRASKDACERLLAHVQEGFKSTHGVVLPRRMRVDVVPLGVDTERFRPAPKAQMREKLGLPAEDFIILWHGRLSAADKADLLPVLRVFQRLVRRNPERSLRLIIAGSDIRGFEFAPALEAAARDLGVAERVLLKVGFPPNDSPFLYAAADAFVSPIDNVQETFGLTPLEAMACGVPQVVSDWDGYRDTVQHGETGFLVPTYWTHCDEDLTRAARLPSTPVLGVGLHHFMLGQSVAVDLGHYERSLQALIDSPALCARMSEASRRRAVEVYGWPVIIRRLEALWEELIEVARHTPFPPVRERPRRYDQPRYVEAFQSYPTRLLGLEVTVRLSEVGADVLADRDSMPVNYGPLDMLAFDGSALREALLALEAAGPAGLTLGHLAERLRPTLPGPSSLALRHVMRLLKHGLVELVDSVPGR